MKYFFIQKILFSNLILFYVSAQKTLPTGCLEAFRSAALTAHNQYRSLCGVPLLDASNTIDISSQDYATQMAATNLFQHSVNSSYGENLYQQYTSQDLTVSLCSQMGNQSVAAWYKEIAYYNYSNPGFDSKTGHYTQVVWKSSTMLGMGLGWSILNGYNYYYVVGQYSPAGNYLGQFATNVFPPLSTITTTPMNSTTTTTLMATLTTSVAVREIF